MCRSEFLNYLRVREWQDVYSQLRQIARTLGIDVNTAPADPKRIHLSLLSGLLSHIGLKDPEKHEYVGARGARFAIFPGSALFKKQPRWVMSAELVETSRLWARVNARIEPEWVEELAGHLVKRTYSEPHWEKNRGAVMAHERVTLYGVPIVTQRRVDYGRIDPRVARELFIRHALVQGEWDTRHAFFHANRRLLEEVEDLEHRARRRDILVDDETLFDFYDQRVGADVVSARHFDSWWKRTRREHPHLLDFDRSMLVSPAAGDVTEEDYPDFWQQGEHRFRLTYQFEPGDAADGVTAHIPLKVLNQVTAEGFEWQIPGLREELVTALMRSLPKAVRRSFVPVPDHARSVLKRLRPRSEPLLEALSRELTAMGGPRVTVDDWQWERVPDHLRMTFRAVDDRGRALAEAKDLEELRRRLQPRLREAISAEAAGIERTGLTSWDFGPLPRTFERRTAGHVVKGYPALVDEGTSVGVRIFDNEAAQRRAMTEGTRRLLMLTVPSPAKFLQGHLSNQGKLVFSRSPHGSVAALFDDCVACGVDSLVAESGGPVWDPESFAKLREHVRVNLVERVMAIVAAVERILAMAQRLEKRLRSTTSLAVLPSIADIQGQLAELVGPGFVTAAGYRRLGDLPRYLRAIEVRLDRLPDNPRRDQVNTAKVEQMRQAYQRLLDRLPPGVPPGPEHENIRWMLEELRISYFAQEVGTAYTVSDKRILRAIDEVRQG
ncbi:RNA helicase HrpA [Thermobifida halotolerans]